MKVEYNRNLREPKGEFMMTDRFKEHNKPLIDAIAKLNDYPSMETERQVYLSLPNTVFLMPTMVDDKDKMTILDGRIITVEPGTALRVAQFSKDDGGNLYPAFTDLDEVGKWDVDLEKEDIYLLEMDMDGFLSMLSENPGVSGFVIDPFTINLILEETQLTRYQSILEEEMQRDSLINPMSRLMDELRYQPSQDVEERIYQAFQNFRFLMPIFVNDKEDIARVTDEGIAEMKDNAEMNVVPLENEDGERVFPVFTDLYEVKRSGIDLSDEHNYLVEMTMDGMEDLVHNSDGVMGFAINPFTHNVIISDAQFEHYHQLSAQPVIEDREVLAQQVFEEADDETKEALMREEEAISNMDDDSFTIEKDVERADLEKALSKEMDALGNIHRAYLLRKVYNDKTRFLVIVDKERDGKSVFGDLRDAAFPILDFEDQIEFLSYNDPEAKEYTEGVEPFYEKTQKRGLFGFLKGKK